MATIYNTKLTNTTLPSNYSVTGLNGYAGAITNTGTISWAPPPPQNFVSNNGNPIMTIPHDSSTVILEDRATLEVKGKVKINGLDLEERLKTIERILAIPERDATIEAKYPSLKKKFDEYINALEKYRTFERIKGDSE